MISTLEEGSVQQTAIHKHLPDLSTPVWWTHIKGTGNPVEMAKTINNGLTKTKTLMEEFEKEIDLSKPTKATHHVHPPRL